MILLPTLMLASLHFKSLKKYSKKLFEQLIFKEIVIISLEAYYEFLVGGYMNFLYPLEDKSGEYIGRYSAYYSLSVCVVILPGLMVFIMF